MAARPAFSQGSVEWVFFNPSFFSVDTNTSIPFYDGRPILNGSTGPTSTTAGSFYYELLYNTASTQQPTPTTLAGLNNWRDTGLEAQNATASAGKVIVTPATSSTSATVPFTTATSIMMVGWSANLGSTWSAASAILNSPSDLDSVIGVALCGLSSTAFFTPSAPGTNPGAIIFGSNPGEIDSPNAFLEPIIVIPEPITLALGALGAFTLTIFRRKSS